MKKKQRPVMSGAQIGLSVLSGFLAVVLIVMIFVTAYAIVLYLYRTRSSRYTRQLLLFTFVTVIIAESSINTFNTSVGTVSRSQYLDELDEYAALYEEAQALEDGFFRMEKFTRESIRLQ